MISSLTKKHRQQGRGRIFESGLVFYHKNNEINQKLKVACALWGEHFPEQWRAENKPVDFFDIKGDVETLLDLTLDGDSLEFVAGEHPALEPGQTAQVCRNNKILGWVGALSAKAQQHIDIPGKIYVMELDMTLLAPAVLPIYRELSRFPSVRRDIALVIDAAQETGPVEALIREKAGEFLTDIVIFDVYQGQNIGKTKKSLALGLTFQHPSRTLTDEEINAIIDSCIKDLEAQFNAELRM